MDGRVQPPVMSYLKNKFDVLYVDVITEPAPVTYLADQTDSAKIDSILHRADISINKHKSSGIAIAAHHDCAGNSVPKEKQLEQLDLAVKFLKQKYTGIKIIGLWVDDNWSVTKVC